MFRIPFIFFLIGGSMIMSKADLLGSLPVDPLSIVSSVTDNLPVGDALDSVTGLTEIVGSPTQVLEVVGNLPVAGGVVDKVTKVTKVDPKTLIRTLRLLALLGQL